MGDTISYTYQITNAHPTEIVVISNALDDRIGPITCPALISPDTETMCDITDYTVQIEHIETGFVNSRLCVRNEFTHDYTFLAGSDSNDDGLLVCGPALPQVSKVVTTQPWSAVGNTISYAIELENQQSIVRVNVLSIDDPLAPLTCSDTLPHILDPNGDIITCTADYIVDRDDIEVNDQCRFVISNTVTAVFEVLDLQIQSPPPQRTTTRTVEAPGPECKFYSLFFVVNKKIILPTKKKKIFNNHQCLVPDLQLTTTAGNPFLFGVPIEFTYTLVNDQQLTEVVVTELIDSLGSTISCPTTAIAPGATLVCTGEFTPQRSDFDARAALLDVDSSAFYTLENTASVTYAITETFLGDMDSCVFTDSVTLIGPRMPRKKKKKSRKCFKILNNYQNYSNCRRRSNLGIFY